MERSPCLHNSILFHSKYIASSNMCLYYNEFSSKDRNRSLVYLEEIKTISLAMMYIWAIGTSTNRALGIFSKLTKLQWYQSKKTPLRELA